MIHIHAMYIKPNDLGLLVSLCALLEEANVTRAAAKMGLSQPAMSAQLTRLRDVFKDPLLVPSHTGKGMVPTARGLALKEPMRAALQSLQDLVSGSPEFDPEKSERRFSLATTDSIISIFSGSLLPQMDRKFRNLRLAFKPVQTSTLPEQLCHGEIDVALVSDDVVPKELRSRRLLQGRFIMAQRRGHPRGGNPLTLEEYTSLRHVVILPNVNGGAWRGFIDDALHELGTGREVAISVQNLSIVPDMLEKTDFVCTFPSFYLQSMFGKLDCFDLPFETRPLYLTMAWHERFDDDPAHCWLRQQVLLSMSAWGRWTEKVLPSTAMA